MPLKCIACQRVFSELCYLTQHLEKSRICKREVLGREESQDWRANLDEGESKLDRSIAQVEAALAVSQRANSKRKSREAFDHSAFDFHGSDSEQEEPPRSKRELQRRQKKNADAPKKRPPRLPKLDSFHEYCEYAEANFVNMEPKIVAGVRLKKMLNDIGAPQNLYDEIFKWHVENLEATEIVGTDALHKYLVERSNMEDCMPYEHEVYLPSADATVKVTCHDFMAQIKDLLTDPRISAEDYLFHNGDPAAPPPDEWEFLADVNTGESYRKTYDELIRPKPVTECGRQRVLLPILGYLDGCVTGQFNNLGIEIFKITAGILTRECRNQDHAWRKLGFVHKVVKGQEKAKEILAASNHVDAGKYTKDPNYRKMVGTEFDEDAPKFDPNFFSRNRNENNNTLPTTKAQDLHTMLQAILHSYHITEQEGGFPWDFIDNRPFVGPVLKGYWLVPFLMLIKTDGQEADKLTGQFISKGNAVAGLCRYCICPTDQSNVAYRDDTPKTQEMILNLVKKKKFDDLDNISQQYIWNAFYPLRFGSHNKLGIHGAVAVDPLHTVDIGQFGYARACFFKQVGESSGLATSINDIATTVGILLKRQSDKDLPRTTFSKGIKKGKLMAHEMSGILLVLDGAIRCSLGRDTIWKEAYGDAKAHFPPNNMLPIRKWILLLETKLQWSEWLKWPIVKVESMRRFKMKSRELMNMDKSIAS